jgi:hypothetical protein
LGLLLHPRPVPVNLVLALHPAVLKVPPRLVVHRVNLRLAQALVVHRRVPHPAVPLLRSHLVALALVARRAVLVPHPAVQSLVVLPALAAAQNLHHPLHRPHLNLVVRQVHLARRVVVVQVPAVRRVLPALAAVPLSLLALRPHLVVNHQVARPVHRSPLPVLVPHHQSLALPLVAHLNLRPVPVQVARKVVHLRPHPPQNHPAVRAVQALNHRAALAPVLLNRLALALLVLSLAARLAVLALSLVLVHHLHHQSHQVHLARLHLRNLVVAVRLHLRSLALVAPHLPLNRPAVHPALVLNPQAHPQVLVVLNPAAALALVPLSLVVVAALRVQNPVPRLLVHHLSHPAPLAPPRLLSLVVVPHLLK